MAGLAKICLTVAVAFMLASGLIVPGCSSSNQAPEIGKLAPDFQLISLDGRTVSLSDYRGKPVLLNFWASWCGPCQYEMPFLQQTYEKWTGRGLVVLAVNLQESPDVVKEFMVDFGLSLPVLLATDPKVPLSYNVRGIPATFFIDKSGIIRDIKVGPFISEAEIEERLLKIM